MVNWNSNSYSHRSLFIERLQLIFREKKGEIMQSLYSKLLFSLYVVVGLILLFVFTLKLSHAAPLQMSQNQELEHQGIFFKNFQ